MWRRVHAFGETVNEKKVEPLVIDVLLNEDDRNRGYNEKDPKSKDISISARITHQSGGTLELLMNVSRSSAKL
jgi:hypothetical protein